MWCAGVGSVTELCPDGCCGSAFPSLNHEKRTKTAEEDQDRAHCPTQVLHLAMGLERE